MERVVWKLVRCSGDFAESRAWFSSSLGRSVECMLLTSVERILGWSLIADLN